MNKVESTSRMGEMHGFSREKMKTIEGKGKHKRETQNVEGPIHHITNSECALNYSRTRTEQPLASSADESDATRAHLDGFIKMSLK